jgi:hypothetical protein
MRFGIAWALTFVLLVAYSGFSGMLINGDFVSDLLPAGNPTNAAWFSAVAVSLWIYFAFISALYSGFFRLMGLAGARRAFEYCLAIWALSSVPSLLLAFMKGMVDRTFVISHLGAHFVFFLVLALVYSVIWRHEGHNHNLVPLRDGE